MLKTLHDMSYAVLPTPQLLATAWCEGLTTLDPVWGPIGLTRDNTFFQLRGPTSFPYLCLILCACILQ